MYITIADEIDLDCCMLIIRMIRIQIYTALAAQRFVRPIFLELDSHVFSIQMSNKLGLAWSMLLLIILMIGFIRLALSATPFSF